MILIILVLSIIAWFLAGLKIRYKTWSDFVYGFLMIEFVSIIAGLGMSAWIIGRNPYSLEIESTVQKLQVVGIITGSYLIFVAIAMIGWIPSYRKWQEKNSKNQKTDKPM